VEVTTAREGGLRQEVMAAREGGLRQRVRRGAAYRHAVAYIERPSSLWGGDGVPDLGGLRMKSFIKLASSLQTGGQRELTAAPGVQALRQAARASQRLAPTMAMASTSLPEPQAIA